MPGTLPSIMYMLYCMRSCQSIHSSNYYINNNAGFRGFQPASSQSQGTERTTQDDFYACHLLSISHLVQRASACDLMPFTPCFHFTPLFHALCRAMPLLVTPCGKHRPPHAPCLPPCDNSTAELKMWGSPQKFGAKWRFSPFFEVVGAPERGGHGHGQGAAGDGGDCGAAGAKANKAAWRQWGRVRQRQLGRPGRDMTGGEGVQISRRR